MTDNVRGALESMVWQFAYPTMKDGRPALGTGGLSALEQAFAALGFDDPYTSADLDGAACDAEGCVTIATSGMPTPEGYKHFCDWHFPKPA